MSTSDKICKDGASKSSEEEEDGICEVNDMLHKMSTDDKDIVLSVCANCGKTGDNLKACTACKLVKYCNRECQIAHRPQHKKECRIRAAQLQDEKLFKQPPPEYGDCPICFLRMPSLTSGSTYYSCCGKVICSGCIHAPLYDNQGNKVVKKKCPFCRAPAAITDEKIVDKYRKRVEAGDPLAMYNVGYFYKDGMLGLPQDYTKAFELWHKAGKLGCSVAYHSIGVAYNNGAGVEVDKKKAKHYYELAAMMGDPTARYYLGVREGRLGNLVRALRHYMIAVRGGNNNALKEIKELYSNGHATKDDYTNALQSYQEYLGEIKSTQRDKAAEADDMYRYY